MCFQLCHISVTNDMQKAGSSADGIQYYLMLLRQNPHKHEAHWWEKVCSVLAKH